MDWSDGCGRTALNCSGDGLRKYSDVKLPETRKSWFNKSMNLEECKSMCIENCSCTAYANLDVREGGSGCLLWFSELIDMRQWNENGQDIYIRMAASELDDDDDVRINSKSNKTKRMRNIVISVVPTGMLLLGLVMVLFFRKQKQKKGREVTGILKRSADNNCKKEYPELQLFDFGTISCSTNNFSITNKLGEGGFGPVYKGLLKDGQEIAVKRLSKSSRQGLDEFKNEVMHIAKLQHRNLVKLLGCCIQADERMLVYEFMPKKKPGLPYFCGYISPEYAIDGIYSIKSDVFSFGVLMLEIVSGSRNRGFSHPDHDLNLLGHPWRLFTKGRSCELITEPIEEPCNLSEVLRSIHVGLLCVQCRPNDRPSMSSVVLMLCGEGKLPQPKQSGFFTDRALVEESSSSRKNTSCSVNDSTITVLEAR